MAGSHRAVPSCALVSNGALIKGTGMGPEIDANSLVMRLNNAPTKRAARAPAPAARPGAMARPLSAAPLLAAGAPPWQGL